MAKKLTWIFIGPICNTVGVLYTSIKSGISSGVAVAMNYFDMSYEMM